MARALFVGVNNTDLLFCWLFTTKVSTKVIIVFEISIANICLAKKFVNFTSTISIDHTVNYSTCLKCSWNSCRLIFVCEKISIGRCCRCLVQIHQRANANEFYAMDRTMMGLVTLNWMWYEWMIQWREKNSMSSWYDGYDDDRESAKHRTRANKFCVRFESTMRYNWLLSTVSNFCFTCQSSKAQVFGALLPVRTAYNSPCSLQQGDRYTVKFCAVVIWFVS